MVERVIQSLTKKLWRFLYNRSSWCYIDHLQALVRSYNATKHSSINARPDSVMPENAPKILMALNKKLKKQKPKPEFAVGDIIRVVYAKKNLPSRTCRPIPTRPTL